MRGMSLCCHRPPRLSLPFITTAFITLVLLIASTTYAQSPIVSLDAVLEQYADHDRNVIIRQISPTR
jgi:hypothetical protein